MSQYPVLIGIVPVSAALFYASILVTIISYQKVAGLQAEKKRYFVEQQQGPCHTGTDGGGGAVL